MPALGAAGQQIADKLIEAKAWVVLDTFLDRLMPLLGQQFDRALVILNAIGNARGQIEAARWFKKLIADYPVQPFAQRKVGNAQPIALLLGAADADFTLNQGFSIPGGHVGVCELIQHSDVPVKMVLVNPKMKLNETRLAIKDCALVINAIADADQLPVSVDWAARFCKPLKIPIINAPSDVALNVRDLDWQRFANRDDILWPRTLRVLPEDSTDEQLISMFGSKDWRFPLTVRKTGVHGGEGLEKIDDMEALIARLRKNPSAEHFVAQWIDFKSDDGWYRKYRVYRIGGKIVPYHLYIDSDWKIHFGARKKMTEHPEMVEEERAVIMRERADLEKTFEFLMDALWQATGLDYLGCDFSILPDGTPVVFEANACMKPNIGAAAQQFPSNAHAGQALIDAFKGLLEK